MVCQGRMGLSRVHTCVCGAGGPGVADLGCGRFTVEVGGLGESQEGTGRGHRYTPGNQVPGSQTSESDLTGTDLQPEPGRQVSGACS